MPFLFTTLLEWAIQKNGEERCYEGFQLSNTERFIRSITPIVAGTFVVLGGVMMAYWLYKKIRKPEEEVFKLAEGRPIEYKEI